MPLCVLHVSTSTPPSHLRNSIPLCVLHVPTPAARLHRISGSPYLYASYTSLYPQHACIASPEIHTSTRPTRPYTRSTPASHLRNSILLRVLLVPTPAARLQISIPLHLHV